MRNITKIAEKLNISEQLASKMIISEHEMFKLSSKSNLVKVDVDINAEALLKIKNIATKLKISKDAVVCGLLVDYIEKRKHAEAIRSEALPRKRSTSKRTSSKSNS